MIPVDRVPGQQTEWLRLVSEVIEELQAPVEQLLAALTREVLTEATLHALKKAGVKSPDVQLRRKGDGLAPLITDGGHYILDCACGAIPDARLADRHLKEIPGVVEHGLFLDLARVVIVGEDNEARVMEL